MSDQWTVDALPKGGFSDVLIRYQGMRVGSIQPDGTVYFTAVPSKRSKRYQSANVGPWDPRRGPSREQKNRALDRIEESIELLRRYKPSLVPKPFAEQE